MRFRDRADAGKKLAQALMKYQGQNGVVYALPRGGVPVGVINAMGRVFMAQIDDPFRGIDAELQTLRDQARVVFVDFHAEATSEKVAMGWHLDGRVSAVVGTHRHVQTADERLLPKGTAYITDLGLTGPVDSVIGVEPELALGRFLSGMPNRFEPAKGPAMLQGAVIRIDPETGRGLSIERLRVPLAG